MFSVGDLKSFLKIGRISIDNWVFVLHYKLTVIILLVLSILVGSSQYFGDPIDCTLPPTEISNYVDSYCWFNAYTLIDEDGNVFTQVKKLELRNKLGSGQYSTDIKHYKEVKQNFYQWIGMVLLIQAGFFYAPRFIWKVLFEEGRVKELVRGLENHIADDSELEKRQEKIIEYIKNNKGHHLFYALKFFFCEVLNFANVICQIILTDYFLGHAFLKYGIQWLWYNPSDDVGEVFHPSHRYFPKEALCRVYFGSATGAESNFYSARCILPIQIFNERIYLFLWFYFIILAAITGCMLIYRIIVLLFPGVRYYLFCRKAWATDEKILRTVVYDFDIGDWFIIYQMVRNMDPFVFGKLMKKLHEKLVSGSRAFSAIGGGEESHDQLLDVYATNANYDIDEKHEKLNLNQGLARPYFSNN